MAVHGPYIIIRYKLVPNGTPLYQEQSRTEVRSKSQAFKMQQQGLREDGCWPEIVDSKGNYLDLGDQ